MQVAAAPVPMQVPALHLRPVQQASFRPPHA